jgi:predicted membrane channel-forming protein YqfA (hemolysin III family)
MKKKTFDGFTFHWSNLELQTASKQQAKKCTELNKASNQYVVEVAQEACWRVMFRGCCSNTDQDGSESLIGRMGHLERANAWTHFVACIFFMIFAFTRPFLLGASTVSDHLSTVSIVLTATTFAVSTVYHVYSSVPSAAPATRTLDHASIAISICCATIADLAMTTKNFENISFQAWLDPLIGSLVLIVYFGTRRLFIPTEETKQESYTGEGCTLGLYRIFHSDLEHAALRAAGSAALTLTWVMLIPAAFNTLDVDPAIIWVVGASIGTLLLIVGIIIDNTGVVDDVLMRNKRIGPCSCNSQALGCVFNTHALWHVIAVAGAVSSIFAREYGIASWK